VKKKMACDWAGLSLLLPRTVQEGKQGFEGFAEKS
jgi:hypothetical protein